MISRDQFLAAWRYIHAPENEDRLVKDILQTLPDGVTIEQMLEYIEHPETLPAEPIPAIFE